MRRIAQLSAALLMAFLPYAAAAAPPPDRLVKASGQAVYYFANDGKRYVFPNEGTYLSWFSDFSGIVQLSDAELAAIPLGGNVTYRPGIQMLKVQTDPKVYAVAPGGTLRWVMSERVAEDLYGQYWNQAIHDVSDAFFVNYRIGDPIDSTDDFSPLDLAEQTDTINADKGIAVSSTPRRSDTEPANIVDAWRAYALTHLNELRQQNGKGPLVMNRLMNYIATIHSKDMAINIGVLSHNGSLGETFYERISQGKVPDVISKTFITVPHPNVGYGGENVGVRTTNAKSIVVEDGIKKLHDAFMDEPPDEQNHRTNMLGTFAPFTEVGIGVYVDAQNGLWLTEDFASLQ